LPSCSFANSAPKIASHTTQVGHVKLDRKTAWDEILAVNADLDSPLRCVDSAVQDKMKAEDRHGVKSRRHRRWHLRSLLPTTFPSAWAAMLNGTKSSTAASPKP